MTAINDTQAQQIQKMTIGTDKYPMPLPPKFDNKQQQQQYEKQR
jgi:hypothetical protein